MAKITFTKKKKTKIENVGYIEIKDATDGNVELYIYGDIVSSTWEKWSDEDRCPQDITDFLKTISPTADITLYINSCGGDVFAGIGIYNILLRHKGHITGIVDGIAASIASVILMACDDIIVSTGAQIMIHKPLTYACGNADDFAAAIEQLNHCQESITDIYMTKAKEGIEREDIEKAINAETWLSGAAAAEYFNIKVEEHALIAACAGDIIGKFKNMPENIKIETVEDINTRNNEAMEAQKILSDLDFYGI